MRTHAARFSAHNFHRAANVEGVGGNLHWLCPPQQCMDTTHQGLPKIGLAFFVEGALWRTTKRPWLYGEKNMLDFPMVITLLTLAASIILLVGNFLRNDVVAVLIILTLMLTGVLQTSEALSGFSSNAVIIIACMFIVGKAVTYTGIAQRVGEGIITYGGTNEKKLLAMIMVAAALVGAFMSSTATAAIFIPITMTVAEKANLNHKRLLMPLAVASLISGMMTLVATTPNIIINGILRDQGLTPLSFFSFTPFGALVLLFSILFMLAFGLNMLAPKGVKVKRKKEPSIDDLLQQHKIAKNEYLLRVPAHSDLVDRSVARMQLNALHHIILLAVESGETLRKREIAAARPEMVFRSGDLLMVIGIPEHIQAFTKKFSLHTVSVSTARRRAFFQEVGIAEVMLNPNSTLLGKSLKETMFQSIFQSMVLGIRRKSETLTEDIADLPLKFGDILLVCGAWKDILRLEQNRDQYLLLTLPQDHKEVIPFRHKEKAALIILAVMVALMVFNLLPPVAAILAATAALLLARCVPLSTIYTVVDWQTIVMIAGILPLALALQKTGVIDQVSMSLMGLFATTGPLVVLTSLYLVTALLGLFMSNTAVAVLVAPMAVDVGLKLGINPQACAMTVAIACSAAFVSPLGSPVHMVVREPGGYSLKDYARVGTPLLVLSLAATVFLAWLVYLE